MWGLARYIAPEDRTGQGWGGALGRGGALEGGASMWAEPCSAALALAFLPAPPSSWDLSAFFGPHPAFLPCFGTGHLPWRQDLWAFVSHAPMGL